MVHIDTENAASLKRVIHLKIPHVGEHIFESIDTPGLIKCLEVSQTWNELAGNVLIKRWKRNAIAIPKLMLEACQKGQIKVVQLLLERYYNSEESGLDIKDCLGRTTLMIACENGHKGVVKLLLEHSDIIELNTSDIFGWTAFIYACTNGHTDVVKLLLDTIEMNIDLNARSNEGSTAIMLACRHGHKDVVQLLLNHSDIDLYVKDNSGRTALMIARRWKRKDIVYLLELKSSSYVIL